MLNAYKENIPMNDEEVRSTVEETKAQVKAKPENKDKSDDEIDELILDAFFKAYTEGKMSKDDLENLAAALGYEFTDEFKNDQGAPEEVKDAAPAQEGEEGGDEELTKEEAAETQVIKPGESKEEFKEKIEEAKGEGEPAPEADKEPEPEAEEPKKKPEEDEDFAKDDDEEDQKAKASELFGGMKF